jgi:hypothetical protein
MEATEEVCAACNGDEFVRRDDGRLDYCDSCQLPPAVRIADALERIAAVQEANLALMAQTSALMAQTNTAVIEDAKRRATVDDQAHVLAQEAQANLGKMAKAMGVPEADDPPEPPDDRSLS